MTQEDSILELGAWLHSPPGARLVAWEQARLDQAVTDAFGYHALQLGLPELEGLRANRMPHRWIASPCQALGEPLPLPAPADSSITTLPPPQTLSLHCDFEALPFPSQSIDLVVAPHTLELAHDPYEALREVERVLVPEGRLVVTGFNPASLWGLRQRLGHVKRGTGMKSAEPLYLPRAGEFIGYWRLRDWMRLLGFEIETGRFGCYVPPLHSQAWLDRWQWMEAVGDRWWPVLGAVYTLSAVKRVRGMRLVGLARRPVRAQATAAAVVKRETEPVHRR
jgi:SAM-dependent methyltransferase